MHLLQRIRQAFPFFCVSLAIFAVGLGIGRGFADPGAGESLVRRIVGPTDLVAQSLYLQVPESNAFPRYQGLDTNIAQYAANPPAHVSQIGIYFRDMNADEWVGANETVPFWPASLIKVATMIAVFKKEEADPSFADQQFSYDPATTPPIGEQDYFPPIDPAQPNLPYPVDDLMTRMIEESDDNSNAALVSAVGIDAISQVFDDLQVTKATNSSVGGDSAQEYSRFFRVLYNGSYISLADSETALGLLSRTNYTQGLVAGVPAGTTVAHKFGESTDATADPSSPSLHQLHDCGIVYYPGHPYFLCVMTRGSDFAAQANAIKAVSALAWKEVGAVYGSTAGS